MRCFIFLIPLFLYGCTAKIDRLSRKYFKKEIKKEEVVLFAHYKGPINTQHYFTLRANGAYAHTYSYFGQMTYQVGTWVGNESLDTIRLVAYLDHELADFIVIPGNSNSKSVMASLQKDQVQLFSGDRMTYCFELLENRLK